jgi:hypothetical protein
MELIYNNKETKNFIEFTVDGIDENIPEEKIIDLFMHRIKTFDDNKGIKLPPVLLSLLSDEELDLFLLAAYNKDIYKRIEKMLYVVKYNNTIVDQHGTKYNVDYVGKFKTVISFEMADGLAVFNIPTSELRKSVFSLNTCSQEVF